MNDNPLPPDRLKNVLTITASHVGQRLDNYLCGTLKVSPRSYLHRIIRTGQVRVNGGRVKAHYRLQLEDTLRVPPQVVQPVSEQAPDALSQSIKQSICYEDEDFVAINKPEKIAVHKGSSVTWGVIDRLQPLYSEKLYLCHRLDRATSGCLLVAKKRQVVTQFQQLLQQQQVKKTYYAWLHCADQCPQELTIDAPLQVANWGQKGHRVRVDEAGVKAVTHMHRLKRQGPYALYEVEIETGRMHQIRVHCQYQGMPVVGDELYASSSRGRLLLHAIGMSFTMEGRHYALQAPLPENFVCPS